MILLKDPYKLKLTNRTKQNVEGASEPEGESEEKKVGKKWNWLS